MEESSTMLGGKNMKLDSNFHCNHCRSRVSQEHEENCILANNNNRQISLKHDSGKLRYDLIPPECLQALAEVFTYGAIKYKDNSWQGIERERYVAALFRHLQAWRQGEKTDAESGLHHLAHAMTNVCFLLFKDNHKIV